MTLFEFYLKQFEENTKADRRYEENVSRINELYGKDTYKWFKAMSKNYFGGGYLWRYTKAGITIQQLREAKKNGLVKYYYYSNWLARQLGNTDWYGLTEKGLKVLYKMYKEANYEKTNVQSNF